MLTKVTPCPGKTRPSNTRFGKPGSRRVVWSAGDLAAVLSPMGFKVSQSIGAITPFSGKQICIAVRQAEDSV